MPGKLDQRERWGGVASGESGGWGQGESGDGVRREWEPNFQLSQYLDVIL